MSLHTFLPKAKPPFALPLAGWLSSTGARSACKETAYSVERETGLEPATACLEGRRLRYRRSLDLHRPYSRFYTVHVQCERAWQNMSRAFFSLFGKTRCSQLGTGGHAAVLTIPCLFTFGNVFKERSSNHGQ